MRGVIFRKEKYSKGQTDSARGGPSADSVVASVAQTDLIGQKLGIISKMQSTMAKAFTQKEGFEGSHVFQ